MNSLNFKPPTSTTTVSIPCHVEEWRRSANQLLFFDNSSRPVHDLRPATSHETSRSRVANSLRDPSAPDSPVGKHKKTPSSISTSALTRETPQRRPSGFPKSPSVPTFRAKPDVDEAQICSAASDIVSASDAPLLRRSNTQVSRSPRQKRRAPAYHSSYGVETNLGPPPSYSTQRTLSQDRVRKLDNPNRLKPAIGDDPTTRLQESDLPVDSADAAAPRPHEPSQPQSTPEVISSPETAESQSIDTPKEDKGEAMAPSLASYGINIHEDDHDDTITGLEVPADEDGKGSSSDERKSEDLFLNIAKADAARSDQNVRAERRPSRISLPFLSTSRPNNSHKSVQSSARGAEFDPALLTPKPELPQYAGKRSSLGYQYSASAHPLESRQRYLSSAGRDSATGSRSTVQRDIKQQSPERSQPTRRRYSNANTDAGSRGALRSNAQSVRNTRLVSESNALDRPRLGEHTTTESTISTTAPSTVWDELDELKSRIKKLELTGKLPSSSAAAMSTVERPRTATTTVTTMSSSPKNNKVNMSPMQSAIEGVPSNVHPLLHEALDKVRSVVSHEVYQKLQATALDALQLTSMVGGGAQHSSASAMGMPPSAERQIRRRADSMCRGLTELAIALSAESRPSVSPVVRPASKDAPQNPHSGYISRRMSNEPSDRPPITSRVQSRLESRRTSVALGTNRTNYSSPEAAFHTPPAPQEPNQTGSSSRIGRTSTLLRNRRTQAQAQVDGANDEVDTSPSVRPPSRAVTEFGGYRQASRNRTSLSREYTSQHPMPAQYESTGLQRTPLPTGLGSSFLRRKYASPASASGDADSSPITPREVYGRISIVGREPSAAPSSTEGTPENVTVARGSASGSRRGLGIAGRIGSSVGSRLRAVRAGGGGGGGGSKEQGNNGNGNGGDHHQQNQQYHREALPRSAMDMENRPHTPPLPLPPLPQEGQPSHLSGEVDDE